MNTADHLRARASELAEAARGFDAASQQRGSHAAAPESLAGLEETLQVLSTAWYQLAADASAEIVERRGHVSAAPGAALSREKEVRLMGTLHDVAAAFGRCARVCRDARGTVTPIVAAAKAARPQADDPPGGDELAWFASHNPARRVA